MTWQWTNGIIARARQDAMGNARPLVIFSTDDARGVKG